MVVEGIPLTGCLPMAMTLGFTKERDQFGCIKGVNEEAQSHNALLQQGLEGLRSKYPNTAIVYADYSSAHNKVLLNPTQYGMAWLQTYKCMHFEHVLLELFSDCFYFHLCRV